MRIRRRDREAAMTLNEKMLGKLAIQMGERDQAVGFHTQEITRKIQTPTSHNDALTVDENAEEVEFTTVPPWAHPRPTTWRAPWKPSKPSSAASVSASTLHSECSAPYGCCSTPAPSSEAYSDYSHIVSSPDWAGMVPFNTARLLDDTGPIIGVNLLSGLFWSHCTSNFAGKVLADTSRPSPSPASSARASPTSSRHCWASSPTCSGSS